VITHPRRNPDISWVALAPHILGMVRDGQVQSAAVGTQRRILFIKSAVQCLEAILGKHQNGKSQTEGKDKKSHCKSGCMVCLFLAFKIYALLTH